MEEGFFDVLSLGVFAILSPAFDERFYSKPPQGLVDEAANAIRHSKLLFLIFSTRFTILLEGKAVSHFYFVDRMLAEFAAAAVKFAKEAPDHERDGEVAKPLFIARIESILKESHLDLFPYYERCLAGDHKHFTWTGPKLQILPRSEDILSVLSLTGEGELMDHPQCQIYPISDNPMMPPSLTTQPLVGKRRDRSNSAKDREEPLKKQKR